MSDESTPYDVFVSYARRDNTNSWLTAMVNALAAPPPEPGMRPLRVFFDTQEIQSLDQWRNRLQGALRRSRVLLVCLSSNWRASPTCRWEWDAFYAARAGRRAGIEPGLGIVRLEELLGDDPANPPGFAKRVLERVHETQTLLDLRVGKPGAVTGLNTAEAWATALGQAQVQRMVHALWAHVKREREADRAQGNLRGGNPHFVGRERELAQVHKILSLEGPGKVAVIQGLGGMGKTELAMQYAYEHAWHYSAGLWQLQAEGHTRLLPLLATLAQSSHFLDLHGQNSQPLQFTPAEQANEEALGRAVLQALLRRAQSLRDEENQLLAQAGLSAQGQGQGGGAVLLILDNVDRAGLLSQRELVQLPELNQAKERIRFLATSRMGGDQLSAAAVSILKLGQMEGVEARALMLEHRKGLPCPDAAYEAGVERLLEVLGGFTLAIEQVAVYLALNPSVRPEALAHVLEKDGLTKTDAVAETDPRVQGEMLHRERLFSVVLGQTLKSLDEVPLAKAALNFAALLPPEHVPWKWLEALAKQEHPQAAEHDQWEPDPWHHARERLEQQQLLGKFAGDVAWMHRLLAAHLRQHAMSLGQQKAMGRLNEFLDHRAYTLSNEYYRNPDKSFDERANLRAVAQFQQRSTVKDDSASRIALVVAQIEWQDGSLALAGSLFESARQAHEAALRSNPTSAQTSRELSVSLIGLADFLTQRNQLGDSQQALSHYEQAFQIRADLLSQDLTSASATRDYCVSLERLADFLAARNQLGDSERAFKDYEQCLGAREALLYRDESSEQAARDVFVISNKLAKFLAQRDQPGDSKKALEHFERSLQISQAQLRMAASSGQAVRDVSVSQSNLADFLVRRGEPGDVKRALGYYESNLALREQVLLINPGSRQAAHDLANASVRVAWLASQSKQLPDQRRALEVQRRALGLYRKLAQDSAFSSYHLVRALAACLHLTSELVLASGSHAEEEAAALLLELKGVLQNWQGRGGELDPPMARLLDQLQRQAG